VERHLALVEDDDVIRANYVDLLSQAGFRVTAYAGKRDALQGFADLPDLVLLDITMGRERDAGFELCAELRRRSPTLPIIFLTSHDGEVDKISGLRLGADDYLTKDVSIDYLIVRIEALFRRRAALLVAPQMLPPTHVSTNGRLAINEELSAVSWRDRRVNLPLTQFWMLRELTLQPGKVLSHADLMRAAKIVVEPNTVTAHVKAIRDAIRQIDADFDGIRTERGRGYRWVSD
jgi:two-component system OmpR family response regulator